MTSGIQRSRRAVWPTHVDFSNFMPQRSVPRLLALHPGGAFRLGGYCNGGLLAWELAHQLTRAGREVELVVLIETISFNARRAIRAVKKVLEGVAPLAPANVGARIERDGMRALWLWVERVDPHIGRRTIRRISRALAGGPRAAHVSPAETWASGARSIMANYVPPPIDSAVVCPCP